MAEIELTAVEYARYVGGTKQSWNFPYGVSHWGATGYILYEIPVSCKMKKCRIRIDSHCNGMTPSQTPYVSHDVGIGIRLIDNTQTNIFPSSGPVSFPNIHDDEREYYWNVGGCFRGDGSYVINSVSWAYNWANGIAYEYNGNPNNDLINYVWITTAQYIVVNFYAYEASANILDARVYIEPIDGEFIFTDPTYPIDVNINRANNIIFTWNRYHTLDSRLGFRIPTSKKHKVRYKVKNSGVVQDTAVETDDNSFHTVPADTFSVAQYEYQIVDYTYYDFAMYGDWAEFNAIGQNAAPTITSVTNNAIPTIAWTDQNQAAFEIRIKDSNQQIIYQSGFIAGTAQSYRINQMLPNGSYTVEVRELNIYGLYSDWGSYYFTINPTAVTAPTNIFATVNNKYGVEISGTPVSGATKTYVVRREHGSDDIEIIGIYIGGIYVDYTAKANVFYEYTLRNYKNAYADGEWVPLQVVVDKVLIQDGRDRENFIKLTLSEDATFDVNWTEEVDRTLYSCLGRKYPVKEPGEWVNSIRTFTAYVENMDKLQDMNLHAHKVYFKSDKEYFAADMTIEDKGSYVGGGRIVAFTLTRIADDEGIALL